MVRDGLYKSLDESEKDKLSKIEEHVKIIFEKGTVFHPFYTLHGVDHSQAVIEKLDKLTKDLMKSPLKLNHCEVFCLLAAAYLHDTGMLVKNPDDEERVENMQIAGEVPMTYQVSDLIREEHHIRSENYINTHEEELGLNHVEAAVIGKISRGHRKEDLNTTYYEEDVVGDSIRVCFLAALLRLADELDADFRRAPTELRKLLETEMSPLEKVHWIKHYYTKGIIFSEKIEHGLRTITIEPRLLSPSEEYGRKYIVPLVVDPIRQKLDPSAGADYIGGILNKYGIVIECEEPNIETKSNLDTIPPEIFEKAKKHERCKIIQPIDPNFPFFTGISPYIPETFQEPGVPRPFFPLKTTMQSIISVMFVSPQITPIGIPQVSRMRICSSKEDIQSEFKKMKIKTFNVVRSRQFEEAQKYLQEKNIVVIAGVEDSGKTSFAYALCDKLLEKGWKIVFYQEQSTLEKEDIENVPPVLILIDGLEQLGIEEQEAAYRLCKSLQDDCSFLVTYRTEELDRISSKWQREIEGAEHKYVVRFETDEFEKIIKVHATELDIKISEDTAKQFAWHVSQFAGLPSHIVYSFMAKRGSEFGSDDAKKVPPELKRIRNKVIKSVIAKTEELMKSFRFFFLLSEKRAIFLSTKLLKVAFSYYISESIQVMFDQALDTLLDMGLVREIAPDIIALPKEGFIEAVDLNLQDSDFEPVKEFVKSKFLGAINEIRFDEIPQELCIQEMRSEFFLARVLEIPTVDFGDVVLKKDRKLGANALLGVMENVPKDVQSEICKFIINSFECLIDKDAKDWHLLGVSHGNAGDHVKAKECFERVVELDKENVGGWLGLGWIVFNLKDYPRAKECFERVVELDKENVEGWLRLGQAVSNLEDYPRAKECFERVVELDKENVRGWLGLGQAVGDAGDHVKAKECFERVVELDKENVGGWLGLGWIFSNLEDYPRAKECFERVVELDKENVEGWLRLGQAVFNLKDYPRAKECFERVVELDKENVGGWLGLGWIVFNLKDYPRAKECFERVVELDKENAEGWLGLGQAVSNLKDYPRAKECFERVVELDKENVRGWLGLGQAVSNLKDYPRAKECFERVVELDKENAEGWLRLGQAVFNLKDYPRAKECFERVVELDKENVGGWLGLGWIVFNLEDYPRAKECFERVVELDKENVGGWLRLGQAVGSAGDHVKAKECFERVVELDKENVEGWLGLGWIVSNLEDYPRAKECFERVVELDKENVRGWFRLGGLHADQFFQYTDAVNCYEKALQINAEDINLKANLTEAYLCLGNFEKSLILAQELLVKDENPAHQLSMQFFIICNLLFLNRIQDAISQLNKFQDIMRTLPKDIKNTWGYSGTKHFIRTSTLNEEYKKIIFSVIETLEQLR